MGGCHTQALGTGLTLTLTPTLVMWEQPCRLCDPFCNPSPDRNLVSNHDPNSNPNPHSEDAPAM